jgi:hypothetical protein
MRAPKLALIAVVLSCTTSAAGAAAASGRFEVRRLKVDGDVLAVVPADLDGDRHADLLVAYQRGQAPHEERRFAVFWNRGGSFGERPDLALPAGEDTCAFDVAEVDDAPGAELLTVGRGGVSAIGFRGRAAGAPRALTSDPTLFYKPHPGALPRMRIVQDLSGPHGRELLVPLLGALGIYRRASGGYASAARVELDMTSEISEGFRPGRDLRVLEGFTASFAFPAVHVADTDGDGLFDLVLADDDRVTVFRQRPGLSFDRRPSFRREFGTRDASERKESFSSAGVSVVDLDGDRLADLIVRKQVSHGISSAFTTSYVYLGRRGGAYPQEADQVIKSEGAGGSEVELIDLTGDQRPDLVVPSVSVGVWQIIRILTTRTLKVNFQVFPFQADRRFSDKPAAGRELSFKVAFSGKRDLQAVEIRGDYNGDRRPDLAFGVSEDELAIYPGVSGSGLVVKDPIEKIAIHACGELEPIDLDGKGKDDIVMHYPSTAGHRSEIVVLFNKGPW